MLTYVFSTSKKYMTVSIRKCFGSDCVNRIALTAACHWPSNQCIPAEMFFQCPRGKIKIVSYGY